MRIANSLRRIALAATMTIGFAVNVQAADLIEPQDVAEPATPPSGNEFLVAPYAWIAFLSGNMTINGQRISVNTNIFDIIDAADDLFVFEAYSEYRLDQFALFMDFTVLDIGVQRSGSFTPLPIGVGLSADYTWMLFQAGAKYDLHSWTTNGADQHRIIAFGGARYTYNDMTMRIRVGPLRRSASDTLDWIDPLIGLQYSGDFGNGWRANAQADIGGFGITSDISVQLQGTVSKTIYKGDSTEISLAAGYRYLYQDWDNGKRGLRRDAVEMTTHGPIVGLAIRF